MSAKRLSYRVRWSAADGEYVGLCDQFPSLSWLAPSAREAFDGIEAVAAEACEDLARDYLPDGN